MSSGGHRVLHSFPTRRSSDLLGWGPPPRRGRSVVSGPSHEGDRKSTRLNSSHQIISYAVFCLKKKRMANDDHKAQSAFAVARMEQAKTVQAQADYGPAWCVLG